MAWIDRAASRDLFDLWLLAKAGAIAGEAAHLFAQYGSTNKAPSSGMFRQAPNEETWRRDLSEQTRLSVTANEALTVVGDAWSSVA